eukprot:RCo014851
MSSADGDLVMKAFTRISESVRVHRRLLMGIASGSLLEDDLNKGYDELLGIKLEAFSKLNFAFTSPRPTPGKGPKRTPAGLRCNKTANVGLEEVKPGPSLVQENYESCPTVETASDLKVKGSELRAEEQMRQRLEAERLESVRKKQLETERQRQQAEKAALETSLLQKEKEEQNRRQEKAALESARQKLREKEELELRQRAEQQARLRQEQERAERERKEREAAAAERAREQQQQQAEKQRQAEEARSKELPPRQPTAPPPAIPSLALPPPASAYAASS